MFYLSEFMQGMAVPGPSSIRAYLLLLKEWQARKGLTPREYNLITAAIACAESEVR